MNLTDSERICVLSAISIHISQLTNSLHPDPALRNPRTTWEIQNLESAIAKLELEAAAQ